PAGVGRSNSRCGKDLLAARPVTDNVEQQHAVTAADGLHPADVIQLQQVLAEVPAAAVAILVPVEIQAVVIKGKQHGCPGRILQQAAEGSQAGDAAIDWRAVSLPVFALAVQRADMMPAAVLW